MIISLQSSMLLIRWLSTCPCIRIQSQRGWNTLQSMRWMKGDDGADTEGNENEDDAYELSLFVGVVDDVDDG